MSTLRKPASRQSGLARKGHSDNHHVQPLRSSPAESEKEMSEVLVDFAEPLLENINDESAGGFDEAIAFAALCWNLALLSSAEQRAHLREALNAMTGSHLFERRGIEQSIQMLLNRKKTLFADYRRLIVDYENTDAGNGSHVLELVATSP